jgi:23S rRNA (adenine2030-N6)-methyltransferase
MLVQLVQAMQKKDGGILLCDAHAGIGVYDLQSPQAQKTQEYHTGIAPLMDALQPPAQWQDYLQAVRQEGYPQTYPGSPALLAGLLRPQDRLVFNELHPDDNATLTDTFRRQKRLSITQMDAYACLRANTPPSANRGLYLIDPPFEAKDEFVRLCAQIPMWKDRFATGVYMIWYPIKPGFPLNDLYTAVQNSGFHRAWCVEILRQSLSVPDTLNGCGVIILNTPYPVAETAAEWLPPLRQTLSLHDMSMRWLSTSI